jgi:hypothetical protein
MKSLRERKDTLKSCVTMLLKAYGETKSMKWRIGAEDAKAPIATCGYFILNQAANTTKTKFILDYSLN